MNFFSLFGRRGRLTCGLVGAAILLGACGGGSSQVDPFRPTRLIVFGDESSALVDTGNTGNGVKYGVNAFNTATPPALDCRLYPHWSQQVATYFGFTFSQCNPTAVTANGLLLAQPGARAVGSAAADLDQQIATQVAAGGFTANDLVFVMIGQNDVLELNAQYPGRTEDDLVAEASVRGAHVAAQVNALSALGAKVVVATIPEQNYTPFARDTTASATDPDRASRLLKLSFAYNSRIRVDILQDGRLVGLMLVDDLMQAINRSPGTYGLTNVTTAVCAATSVQPNCTTDTLITDGSATTYLWADDTRFGPVMHSQIGSLAVNLLGKLQF